MEGQFKNLFVAIAQRKQVLFKSHLEKLAQTSWLHATWRTAEWSKNKIKMMKNDGSFFFSNG